MALNIGHVSDQFEQSGFFQSCPILFRPGINLKPFLTSMRKLQIFDKKEEEEDNVSQPRGFSIDEQTFIFHSLLFDKKIQQGGYF